MKTSNLNYFAVGLFVITMIVGLVVAVALLSGRTGATDRYHAYYANVTGVKFGTQVVYEGYPIGQVIEVTPEEQDGRMRFRVDFDVTEDWRIPEDSRVEIAAPGLLAAVTLSISAGDSITALAPGAQVNAVERADMFAAVANVAGDFGELSENFVKPLLFNANTAIENFNRMMDVDGDGTAIITDARETMGMARGMMSDVKDRVPVIAEQLEVILTDIAVTTERLNTILSPDNQDKILGMIDNLNAATQKFDEALISMNSILREIDDLVLDDDGDVSRTLEETRYIVESVGRNIDSLNQNMDGAARNLFEFSRQIRQNPGLLLGGSAQPDRGAAQ